MNESDDGDPGSGQFDETLREDYHLLAMVAKRRVTSNAPSLWRLGLTQIADDIEAATREARDSSQLNYGLRAAFDEIIRLCGSTTIPKGVRIYRVRLDPDSSLLATDYDTPPPAIEQTGRFSSGGFPVFYGAFNVDACIHECGTTLGNEVCVATLVCERNLLVVDLSDIGKKEFYPGNCSLYLQALFRDREYETCRLLARRIDELGYDGLVYPSYFSPVQDKPCLDVALFGYPVRNGALALHSLNRIVIDRMRYSYTFGPINAPHRRADRRVSCTDAQSEGDSKVAFNVEFTVPEFGVALPCRVTVTEEWTDSHRHLFAFFLHRPQEKPLQFLALDSALDGLPLAVDVADFDDDGRPEIAVLLLRGAHTHSLEVYRLRGDGRVELIPGTENIGSDASQIEWKDFDHDGKYEIVARHRNWQDQSVGEYENLYRFDGEAYVKSGTWLRGFGGGRRVAPPSASAVQPASLLWTNGQVGIGTWKSTPLSCGNRLFFPVAGRIWNQADEDDGVVCVDTESGDILWRLRSEHDANAAELFGGRIVFGTDGGEVYCGDLETGDLKWKTTAGDPVVAKPTAMLGGIVVASTGGSVLLLDPESGRVLRHRDVTSALVADPLVIGDSLYLACVSGELLELDQHLDVRCRAESPFGDVEQLDCGGLSSNDAPWCEYHAPPTIWDDLIILPYVRPTYDATVPIAAFRLPKLELAWPEVCLTVPGVTVGNIRARATVNHGILIAPTAYGNCTVGIDKSGALKWATECGVQFFPQWGSPEPLASVVLVPRFDGYIHALDACSGEHRWSVYLGDEDNAGRFHSGGEKLPGGSRQPEWKNLAAAPLNSPLKAIDGVVYGLNAAGMAFALKVTEMASH